MEKYIDNKKLIKEFCENLDENFLRVDVELMLDQAGIQYTKGAPKKELCSMFSSR